MKQIASKLPIILSALLYTAVLVAAPRETPPTRAGVVAYIEGQVSLNGQDIAAGQQASPVLQTGSVLSTRQGKAEISVTPRVFLTVGENTQLQVLASSGQTAEFSLGQGEIIIVVTGAPEGGPLTVLDHGASVTVNSPGWYRVTAANPPTAAIINGSAEIRYGENRTKIGKGREVALTSQLPQQRFEMRAKDDLYRWTKVLAEYGAGASRPGAAAPMMPPAAPAQPQKISPALAKGEIPLSVAVFDHNGDPVDELRRTDFRVTDSGKPQQIVSFDVRRNKAPRATMILLDLLNARLSDRARAVDEIIHTVQRLESTDELYLYILTENGGVYPVHPIPVTPAEANPQTPPWSPHIKTMLDDAIRKVNQLRSVDMTDVDIRTQASLANVEGLAARLTALPGRKDLIWVTHGVPELSYWVDYSSQIAELGTKLYWANIAVYTVQQSASMRISVNSGDTLLKLSQLTGGRNYGSDSVEQAIDQSRVDGRIDYEITYKAPPSQPGKYHKIRVLCDHPDTRVLSQQGYYALR